MTDEVKKVEEAEAEQTDVAESTPIPLPLRALVIQTDGAKIEIVSSALNPLEMLAVSQKMAMFAEGLMAQASK